MVFSVYIPRFKRGMDWRFFVVFILGFSSGLPMALVGSTLQAWFANTGMSIMATGMLSLLGLPYVYRMIWAPVVDRYALLGLGKRRSWILVMQLLLFFGFNCLAWCSPLQNPMLMACIALALACCSATQDIVIDAHRTEYLPISLHGIGASLAVFGYRLALLFSGGLALVLAHYEGWPMTYRLMGLLLLPGMLVILLSKEPQTLTYAPERFIDTFFAPVKELLARKGVVSLLLFIFFYKLGEAFTASTGGVMMPFLINGIGFSLDTVGIVNKVIGVMSILLGGLLAGILLIRWSLYKALFCFGLIQAVTNLLFVALAFLGQNLTLLVVAVTCDNFATGMGTTALVVLLMRLVDRRYTASQLAILASIAALPRVLSGPLAAILQSWFGWVGVFQLSFIFALGFIPFLAVIRRLILNIHVPMNGESAPIPIGNEEAEL